MGKRIKSAMITLLEINLNEGIYTSRERNLSRYGIFIKWKNPRISRIRYCVLFFFFFEKNIVFS